MPGNNSLKNMYQENSTDLRQTNPFQIGCSDAGG